jgi:hypothetical protein
MFVESQGAVLYHTTVATDFLRSRTLVTYLGICDLPQMDLKKLLGMPTRLIITFGTLQIFITKEGICVNLALSCVEERCHSERC